MAEFNVMIGIPTSGVVRAGFAASLAQMVSYIMAIKIPGYDKQQILMHVCEGSGISANRDKIVNLGLREADLTHIMFIDDDISFPPDALHQLAMRDKPIVCCNYRMRYPPGDFAATSMDQLQRVPTTKESTGLEEVAFTGFGLSLFKREVMEAVAKPRFMLEYNPRSDSYSTEDSTFFRKAREKGYPCYIDHDLSKQIWHTGNLNYKWDEDVSHLNKGFQVHGN